MSLPDVTAESQVDVSSCTHQDGTSSTRRSGSVPMARSHDPSSLHVDGLEYSGVPIRPAQSPAGEAPGLIHLTLAWPSRGPLEPARARSTPASESWTLPAWGDSRATSDPGEYVLSANWIRAGDAARRTAPSARAAPVPRPARARLAITWRARRHACTRREAPGSRSWIWKRGESVRRAGVSGAARRSCRELSYRERPRGTGSAEWVALQHSNCAVGAGIGLLAGCAPKCCRRRRRVSWTSR